MLRPVLIAVASVFLAACHARSDAPAPANESSDPTVAEIERGITRTDITPAERHEIAQGMAQDLNSLGADAAAERQTTPSARDESDSLEVARARECQQMQAEIDAVERSMRPQPGEIHTDAELAAMPQERDRLKARWQSYCH